MSDAIETEDYKGFTIEVHQDDDPESPRDWDNFGHMICWHNRYNLGDEQPSCDPAEYLLGLLPDKTQTWLETKWEREAEKLWDHLRTKDVAPGSRTHMREEQELEAAQTAELERHLDKHVPIRLPLFLYDHSGITMSTGAFSCPWDSGQVGFIYTTREEVLARFCAKRLTQRVKERAFALLRAEVKTYDDFITGAVYGYVVLDPDGEEADGCWGYYGYDHEESGLMEAAKNAVDCEIRHRRRIRLGKLRELMHAHAPLEVRQRLLAA